MKRVLDRLKALGQRFDAMSLRERAMIFGSAALMAVMLVNTLLIDPLQERRRTLALQLAQAQDKLQAMQEGVREVEQRRAQDPDAGLRAQLDAARREEATLDETLRDKARRLVPPEKAPELLRDILSRHAPLALVSLRSLPAAPFPAGSAGLAAQAASGRSVFRHGVEVVVRGSYLDMLRYMAELEGLPWNFQWGEVSLNAENYPVAQLSFTVYTLSLDKTWLRI
ncbi:MAG TPA: type II secretion system protein GspM [Burkholderiales bacterium]